MKSRKAQISGSDQGAGPERLHAVFAPVVVAVAVQIDAAGIVTRAPLVGVRIRQRQNGSAVGEIAMPTM